MRCDQCHADSGIKKRSKKTFQKAESHDAKFTVLLNGARMLLCKEHKDKLDRSLSRVKFDYDFKAREIEEGKE